MESLENLDAIINAITLLTIIRLIVDVQRPIVNNNRVEEDEVSSNTEIIFSPNLKRHVPFSNIMKQILKSCMESIEALIIEILNFYGIYDYIVYSSVYDKIRNSSSIISFCQMPIKYIFNESAPNQVRNKKQYKEKNKQSNDYLLEKEKNDPNLEIKALNAIFNLPYIDFLEAYINDESTIIIKNNIQGDTKVYFTKDKINQDSSSESMLVFNFDTYKNFAKYKYDKNQKIGFKEKMIDKFLGQKLKRNNN